MGPHQFKFNIEKVQSMVISSGLVQRPLHLLVVNTWHMDIDQICISSVCASCLNF